MTSDELDRALRSLLLGGMADKLTVRAQQAAASHLGPIDFLMLLVHDDWSGAGIAWSIGAVKRRNFAT